jgi:hypothetical protein
MDLRTHICKRTNDARIKGRKATLKRRRQEVRQRAQALRVAIRETENDILAESYAGTSVTIPIDIEFRKEIIQHLEEQGFDVRPDADEFCISWEWPIDFDNPIIIDYENNILDGVRRHQAAIQTGKPFVFVSRNGEQFKCDPRDLKVVQ